MATINIEFALNTSRLNIILTELKKSLGALGRDIKLLDVNAINKQLSELSKSAQKVGQELGNTISEATQKGVENTGEKIAKSFGQKLNESFGKLFAIQTIGTALQQAGNFLARFTESSRKTEDALADLSALTGVTGSALQDFKANAMELARAFGTTESNQLEMFKGILSRFGVDIAGSPEAIKEMAESVNILAKASGLEATQAMDALTTALLQFNISLDDPIAAAQEMSKMMNVMAAGAKEGASEVPQIAEALKQAGAAAYNANLSFEETNAALQVLAKGGKFGAEAGVALRNVLNRMQSRLTEGSAEITEILSKMGIEGQKVAEALTTQGLNAALRMLQGGLKNLGSDVERNVALVRLFGEEAMTSASILLNNADLIGIWQQRITNTNVAYEQSNIVMSTTNSQLTRFVNSVKITVNSLFGQLGSGISFVASAISQLAPLVTSLAAIQNVFGSGLGRSIMGFANSLIIRLVPAMFLTTTATGATTVAFGTLASAIWAAMAPILPWIGLIGGLVGGFFLLKDALTETAQERLEYAKAQVENTQNEIKEVETQRQSIQNRLQLVDQWKQLGQQTQKSAEEQREFNRLQQDLAEYYVGAIRSGDSFEENLQRIEAQTKKDRTELEKMTEKEYQLRIREIHEKTEIVQAEVAVKAEEAKDAIDEITSDLFGSFANINLEFNLVAKIDKVQQAKSKEDLEQAMEDFRTELSKVTDPKVKLEIRKKLQELEDLKLKELETGAREEQEKLAARNTKYLQEVENLRQQIQNKASKSIQFRGLEIAKSDTKSLNSLVEQLAKEYGKSTAEIQAIINSLENAEQAQKKFNQAQKGSQLKPKELKDYADEYTKLATTAQETKTIAEKAIKSIEYQKKINKEISEEDRKALEKAKKDFKESEKTLINLGIIEQKRHKETKTAFEKQTEAYEKQRASIENIYKQEELNLELRKDLTSEEKKLKMQELEKKKAEELLSAYQEIFEIQLARSETGEIKGIEISLKGLKEEDTVKVKGKILDLLKELQAKSDIEVNLKTDPLDNIKKLLKARELQNLELELGLAITGEVKDEDIQKAIEERLKSLQKQIQEAGEKEKVSLQSTYAELLTIYRQFLDGKQKALEDATKKELSTLRKLSEERLQALQKQHEDEKNLLKTATNIAMESTQKSIEERIERERKALDRAREDKRITEEAYNRKTVELENKKNVNIAIQNNIAQGMLLEQKRQQTLEELELKKSSIQKELTLLEQKGLKESDLYRQRLEELSEVQNQVSIQSSIIATQQETISEGITAIITGLIEGSTETQKEGFRKVFAVLAGALKQFASATITNIVLGQIGLLGKTTGFAALVLTPVIKATVTAAVNALMTPIISSLLHFATGGRVNKETIAVVGENETEWIVRDRDIQRIISETIKMHFDSIQSILTKQAAIYTDTFDRQIELFNKQFVKIENKEYFVSLVRETLPREIFQQQIVQKQELSLTTIENKIDALTQELRNFSGRIYVVSEDIAEKLEKQKLLEKRLKVL